ncbi:hypothetical protein VTK56DRAFT_920 [Thermocarpiscus australiensis]
MQRDYYGPLVPRLRTATSNQGGLRHPACAEYRTQGGPSIYPQHSGPSRRNLGAGTARGACRSTRESGTRRSLSHVGDEASLQDAQQTAADEERRAAGQPELTARHDTPERHLCRYPTVWAHPLGDQLGWELRAQEGEPEDAGA